MKSLVKKLISKKNMTKRIYYKQRISFNKRKKDSEAIIAKYPQRIPVIVEPFGDNVPEIDRSKYLVPDDLSMVNFIYVIRRRLKISSEVSIYLFVNDKIIPGMDYVSTIYEKYKDEDGFLYVKYSGEPTFG